MARDKDRRKISIWFSENVNGLACGLGIFFLFVTTLIWLIDARGADSFASCFLKAWASEFLAASICIWGFTLTCTIFLLGRLEEIYYGTSLKRIIIMCFGEKVILAYIFIYVALIPFMVVTYYKQLWLTNGWFQTVNYAYSVGLILFILFISLRDTVIELIRNRTIRCLEQNGNHNLYNDEQFPVLNMIRNLDYDDMWQSNRLRSIILDMVKVAIDKNRLYAVYNTIYLIIQQSGYETSQEKNRTINILSNVITDIVETGKKDEIEEKAIEAAVVEMIIPVFQVDIVEEKGKWVSHLIGILPWEMRGPVAFILLFGAEYLFECGVFCGITVKELVDTCERLDMINIVQKEKEDLKKEIIDYWFMWNEFNHQRMQKIEICDAFIEDYLNMDKRVCTTRILLELQMRKLRK